MMRCRWRRRGWRWAEGLARRRRNTATTPWRTVDCDLAVGEREEGGVVEVFVSRELANGVGPGGRSRREEPDDVAHALHDLVDIEHVLVVVLGREGVGDVVDVEGHPFPSLLQLGTLPLRLQLTIHRSQRKFKIFTQILRDHVSLRTSLG